MQIRYKWYSWAETADLREIVLPCLSVPEGFCTQVHPLFNVFRWWHRLYKKLFSWLSRSQFLHTCVLKLLDCCLYSCCSKFMHMWWYKFPTDHAHPLYFPIAAVSSNQESACNDDLLTPLDCPRYWTSKTDMTMILNSLTSIASRSHMHNIVKFCYQHICAHDQSRLCCNSMKSLWYVAIN
jgi:hypothetical protein